MHTRNIILICSLVHYCRQSVVCSTLSEMSEWQQLQWPYGCPTFLPIFFPQWRVTGIVCFNVKLSQGYVSSQCQHIPQESGSTIKDFKCDFEYVPCDRQIWESSLQKKLVNYILGCLSCISVTKDCYQIGFLKVHYLWMGFENVILLAWYTMRQRWLFTS